MLNWPNENRERFFLAIEFASSSVKIVQIKTAAKRFHLLEARSIPVPPYEDVAQARETLKQAAAKALSGFDLSRHTVFLVTNSLQTYFGSFVVPNISQKDLVDTIKWKVKDELPFAIEEAKLDYKIVPMPGQKKDLRQTVLVTALPVKVYETLAGILRESGCSSFELANAAFEVDHLPYAFAQSTRHLVTVVDIGHKIAEIALYAGGRLDFLRKISFGGELLSQALTQPIVTDKGRIALTMEEADRARHESVFLGAENENLIAGKIEASKLYPLIRPVLQKLTGELRRSFDFYSQEHGEGIERIFLTGGGSRLKGFIQFVEQTLQVPVKPVYFFQDIEISDKLREDDLNGFYRPISIILDRHNLKKPWLPDLLKMGNSAVKFFSYRQTAIAALTAFVLLFSSLAWQSITISDKTKSLHLQIANLQPGYEEAQKVKAIRQKSMQVKTLISGVFSSEPYWEDVFQELSQAFPREVTLSEFSYQRGLFIIKGSFPVDSQQGLLSKSLEQIEGPVFRKPTLAESDRNEKSVTFSILGEAI